jgi:hypothetical protein
MDPERYQCDAPDGSFEVAASKGKGGGNDKGKDGGPEGKGNPGPLPCKSKNNPKCSPESPSK